MPFVVLLEEFRVLLVVPDLKAFEFYAKLLFHFLDARHEAMTMWTLIPVEEQ